jgi:hypothetical protein
MISFINSTLIIVKFRTVESSADPFDFHMSNPIIDQGLCHDWYNNGQN